jgi:hypothetical protein
MSVSDRTCAHTQGRTPTDTGALTDRALRRRRTNRQRSRRHPSGSCCGRHRPTRPSPQKFFARPRRNRGNRCTARRGAPDGSQNRTSGIGRNSAVGVPHVTWQQGASRRGNLIAGINRSVGPTRAYSISRAAGADALQLQRRDRARVTSVDRRELRYISPNRPSHVTGTSQSLGTQTEHPADHVDLAPGVFGSSAGAPKLTEETERVRSAARGAAAGQVRP